MLADLGTKALPADRFGFLTDKMRVVRKRHQDAKEPAAKPAQVKKLLLLLCLTSLVEQAHGMSHDTPDHFDYQFMIVCIVAVIAIWECAKWGVASLLSRWGNTTTLDQTGEAIGDPAVATTAVRSSTLSSATTTSRRMRQRGPVVPAPAEPLDILQDDGDYSFRPAAGKRDYWEWKEEVVIRWHATPRVMMFVPGGTASGPTQDQLTGERETFAVFANGERRHVADNYRTLHKPAKALADREWKGRTELKLVSEARKSQK